MNFIKKSIFALFAVMLMAFSLSGCTDDEGDIIMVSEETKDADADDDLEADTDSPAERIYVYVCGAVKEPGVYKAMAGQRLYEIIKKAGGFTKKADESAINLATEVSDGQMVVVPQRAEKSSSKSNDGASSSASGYGDGKININTASIEELMTLSGIGESKASSIVSYREENGGFSSIEELMNVSGIGQATFDNLKESITVQ